MSSGRSSSGRSSKERGDTSTRQASVAEFEDRARGGTAGGLDVERDRQARPSADERNETLRLRVTAAAIIDQWQKDEGKSDLLALYDSVTTALIDGTGDLKPGSGLRRRPSVPDAVGPRDLGASARGRPTTRHTSAG